MHQQSLIEGKPQGTEEIKQGRQNDKKVQIDKQPASICREQNSQVVGVHDQ